MRLMLMIQLVALIILWVLAYFYWSIFKINLQYIEVQEFDFERYAAPSRGFGMRSLVVCAWAVFVGVRLRAHLELIAVLMLLLGGAFSLLSIALMLAPRQVTIADVFFYWCFYAVASIGLTILAFLLYDKETAAAADDDYADVLDRFE